LGHDTKRASLSEIKDKLAASFREGKPIDDLQVELQSLLGEDRQEYAQNIIDKIFQEFSAGHSWIVKMQKMATEQFYVYSPIGRIRHLYAAITQDPQIVSRQVRRGMNAPIQGFASEIAVKASRLTMLDFYKEQSYLSDKLNIEKQGIEFNRVVHDASYFTVPFEMVIPFLHILQYDSTYGITKKYEEQFGLVFTVEPEIEMEIGVKDTKTTKWDWELPNLIKAIEESVDSGIELGIFTDAKQDILRRIFAPWKNKEVRQYLQTHYPLLNVRDLDKEIKDAVSEL
jgi:hypothetical protein